MNIVDTGMIPTLGLKKHLVNAPELGRPLSISGHPTQKEPICRIGPRLTVEALGCTGTSPFVSMRSRFPVVLGYPWLRQHRPTVNWDQLGPGPTVPALVNNVTAVPDGLPADLAEFADVFSEKGLDTLPDHGPYDCPIDIVEGGQIPHKRLYKLTLAEQKILREYLDENLAKGTIRHSKSPAGAPIMFVKKKDGTLRPVVDYRGLNAVTIKNRHALPLIPVLLDNLAGARLYSKVDLRNAYNHIRIRAGDEWKTAFRTQYGHFEYWVMPFGLSNAPAVFQHMINDIFRDMLDNGLIVYLDDLLIYSKTMEEHQRILQEVLHRLRKARLFAKLEKCEFYRTSIEFLGFIVSAGGLRMDPKKVESVCQFRMPRNRRELQRFLGIGGFYRRFIKNYSAIAAPLTRITGKNQVWTWGPTERAAFETLKAAFTSAPVLQHPNLELPFVVETDASDFAVGAVLSQADSAGDLHPVAYFSRKLTKAELNYSVHDKELLAIVTAFEQWRQYLLGTNHEITVLTDHRNLQWFATSQTLNQRQARWSQTLNEYPFVIKHQPGKQNAVADALSRDPRYAGNSEEAAPAKPLLPADVFVANMEPAAPAARVWTEDEKAAALKECHDSPMGGHFGRSKTYALLKRLGHWKGMAKDVREYVKSCPVCAQTKPSRSAPAGLLQPLPIPDRPWGAISMDFISGLPRVKGLDAILVVVDRLTKMAHFIPCTTSETSESTARLILDNVVKLHGLPDDIVSDRGPQFVAGFWRRLFGLLGTGLSPSSAYHPQSDGQTERVNQIVEGYLQRFVSTRQTDWPAWLSMAEFAYNNAVQDSTKVSPFYANYGRHPRFSVHQTPAPPHRDADHLAGALTEVLANLTHNLEHAQAKQKAQADRHRSETPVYEVNDLVWLSAQNLRQEGPSRKLSPRRQGPYRIVERVSPLAYRIELPGGSRSHDVFHVSLLSRYTPRQRFASPSDTMLPPPVVSAQEFQVFSVVGSYKYKGRLYYRVRWDGWLDDPPTDERQDVLHAAPLHVMAFHEAFPDAPRPHHDWWLIPGVLTPEQQTFVRARVAAGWRPTVDNNEHLEEPPPEWSPAGTHLEPGQGEEGG